jgi:hypothetical protein
MRRNSQFPWVYPRLYAQGERRTGCRKLLRRIAAYAIEGTWITFRSLLVVRNWSMMGSDEVIQLMVSIQRIRSSLGVSTVESNGLLGDQNAS